MAALSAAFGRAYDVVQQTIESLEIPISSFKIDGIFLRLDYLTRTLVNLDSSSSPTDKIVGLLGETMSYLRGIDTETSASAIEFAPKIFSGHCGRPSFEIKEEQLSHLIDQGFQVPFTAQVHLHVAFRNAIPYVQRCTILRSAQSSVKFSVETRMSDCDASISH